MNGKYLAPCGIDCNECLAYQATKADSDQMREDVAQKWSIMFGRDFTKEEINCDGCLSGGKLVNFCDSKCEIRACNIKRELTSCAYCPDYECDVLTSYRNFIMKDSKKNHEELRNK